MASPTGAPPLRPPAQRVFSRLPVQVDLSGGKGTITHDQLVKVATDIFKRVRRSGLDPEDSEDNEAADALYKKLWEEFKEFAKEFPIIFRWIVHRQKFSERPFRIYLQKHHKPMWKDRPEMLREQGEYLVYLWRKDHPDMSAKQLEAYRKHTQKHLKDEQEKFDKAAKVAEADCKANAEARTGRLRARLVELAKEQQLKEAGAVDARPPGADGAGPAAGQ